MDFTSILIKITSIAGIILAIILHEVAHGYAAFRCGDRTAKEAGRLSLDPRVHIDPIGSILVPVALMLFGSGVMFGWAKPVPVDLYRCRNPRTALWKISAAGPAANFLQAFVGAALFHLITRGILRVFAPTLTYILASAIFQYVCANIVLGTFNLIPIPPLDGSKILLAFLNTEWRFRILRFERWGFLLLIVVLQLPFFGPFMQAVLNGFFRLVGLS